MYRVLITANEFSATAAGRADPVPWRKFRILPLLVCVLYLHAVASSTEANAIAKASAFAKSGRPAQAEAVLRSALASMPQSVNLHGELGALLLQEGKYEESVQELGAAVQIDPDRHRYVIMLSEALIGWGHYGVAIDFLHAAEARVGKTPGYHYNLGLAYYSLNQKKEAEAELREALRLAPDLDRAQFLLASCLQETGNLPEAVEAYRKLTRQHPRDAIYWVALGEGLGKMGPASQVEALAAARRGLALSPKDPHAQLVAGTILRRSGDLKAARPLLEQAEKSVPKLLPVHFELARLYASLGESKLAEKEAAIAKELQEQQASQDSSSVPPHENSEAH